jgi:hypothetical protein
VADADGATVDDDTVGDAEVGDDAEVVGVGSEVSEVDALGVGVGVDALVVGVGVEVDALGVGVGVEVDAVGVGVGVEVDAVGVGVGVGVEVDALGVGDVVLDCDGDGDGAEGGWVGDDVGAVEGGTV